MEAKATWLKIGGKTYGLRQRDESEGGVNCKDLCPIADKCKRVSSDRAFCALMKVLNGIELKDFAKYIVCETSAGAKCERVNE